MSAGSSHQGLTPLPFEVGERPGQLEVAELKARVVAVAESVKAAEAELKRYTVTAAIDGVVASLDVSPGTASRPGTTVWAEILNLYKIDACCEVTPQLADGLAFGQPPRRLWMAGRGCDCRARWFSLGWPRPEVGTHPPSRSAWRTRKSACAAMSTSESASTRSANPCGKSNGVPAA
jgi:hypothetical protein